MNKIKNLDFLVNFTKKMKSKGKKIVLCHGDFDFLHLGHVKHFQAAKKMGDYLIVSTTSDNNMQKGINRPIYKEKERVEFLSSISLVDFIYVDHNLTAESVISKIKPNFLVKGADYEDFKKDISGNIKKEKKAVEKYGGELAITKEQTFSASGLINQLTLSKEMLSKIKNLKKKFSFLKVAKIMEKMSNKKVLIIGDAIIDEYVYVTDLGKPSKESIIASLYKENELFLGGVFASVGNLSSFCNNIDFITLTGKEKEYKNFINKNIPKNIKKRIFFKRNQATTKKTRFVERTHSKIKKTYEIYQMNDDLLEEKIEKNIFRYLNKNLRKYDMVIVNDYGHGLLTKKLIQIICKKSKFLAVNAQINAGNRGYNLITKYKKANYYSLDLEEARRATQDKHIEPKKIPELILKLNSGKNISLTMGSHGSISLRKNNKIIKMPSFTNVVVDTMSAGDAFFVISAMLLYLSKSLELSSFVGNLAGSITVGVTGCVPIDRAKFLQSLNTYLKV